jgi:hypothetical protein
MKTRAAMENDCDELRKIYAESGFNFSLPDLSSPMIEAAQLVIDERGEVVMAAMAERTVEIYLLCPASQLHPVVRMEGIRLLHGAIRDTIVGKGYTEGFSFIPPAIERSYGRHLRKRFGWEKTWPAYRILDWKSEVREER